jgi:predicted glutamine amidotransferase
MCRLLGVVAATAAPIADLVPDELARFEGLSALHRDGWGVAHVAPDDQGKGEPRVAKAPERASGSEGWQAAVRDTVTDAALLHIRQASPGMPLVLANTHPFLADRMAFAHNGHAHPGVTLDALVAEVGAPAPYGDTDSERYFSLVRKAAATGPVDGALLATAERIATSATATSLNGLLLTPDTLLAIAWWHAPVIRGAGDGETESDYRLWYRLASDRVVIASTGVAGEDADWRELPHGYVLTVERGSLRVRISGPAEDVAA